VYFVEKYIKEGQYCPMFMNKNGTPKKNKKRPSVKVSSLNAGYIQQWIGKDESISKFVNDAIEAKHRENEREKKTFEYSKMLGSDSFYKIEQLKKNVDELKRNTNMLENKIKILVKDNAYTMKYFVKLKDEVVEGAKRAKELMKIEKKLLKK